MSENTNTPTRILLLTHSRTASNLLARMLSEQPRCLYQNQPFKEARVPRRELYLKVMKEGDQNNNPEQKKRLLSELNDGFERFQRFCIEAEGENKIAFVHTQPHLMIRPSLALERMLGMEAPPPDDARFWRVGQFDTDTDADTESDTFTNATVLPDRAFLYPGTKVIINFRHPLLLVEGHVRGFTENSAYTIADEYMARRMVTLGSTLRWARIMYDWYEEHGTPLGIKPIVLDADDYLGPEKEAVMEKLCAEVGLDPACLIYSWPKTTPEEIAEMPVAEAQAYRTLLASDGVLPGYDSRGRTLEGEMAVWKARHGDEWAAFIKNLVEDVMPDYEYMRTKCLTV